MFAALVERDVVNEPNTLRAYELGRERTQSRIEGESSDRLGLTPQKRIARELLVRVTGETFGNVVSVDECRIEPLDFRRAVDGAQPHVAVASEGE